MTPWYKSGLLGENFIHIVALQLAGHYGAIFSIQGLVPEAVFISATTNIRFFDVPEIKQVCKKMESHILKTLFY